MTSDAVPTERDVIHCTSDYPWDGKMHGARQVRHQGAFEVGRQQPGYPAGDTVRYRCAHCGYEWDAELPQ